MDRSLLRRYTQLRRHRCLLVEAMRAVAFRNMDHLYVTRVALGVSDWTNPSGSDRVSDKMLLDQEMDQTKENRWVLGWASRASWEVYMCLLYAGIEQYRKALRDCPALSFGPLDEWLQRHEELVEHLRAVRHKLLHPSNDTDYLDSLSGIGIAARHAAPDLFLALELLQNQLDDFLEHFRDFLQRSHRVDAAKLSGAEMIAFFRGCVDKLDSFTDASMSAEVQMARRASLNQVEAMEKLLGVGPKSEHTLTGAQSRRVNGLKQAGDDLRLRLPKRPYHKNKDSVQTPVSPQLSVWVLLASFGGQVAQLEERFPSWVLRHRSGFLELFGALPYYLQRITCCNRVSLPCGLPKYDH